MSARITQIPKPDAAKFDGQRKLFLVPTFMLPPGMAEEGKKHLESYWTDVRDHIDNLARSLGKVNHIFHEFIDVGNDEGLSMILEMNPSGHSYIQAMCKSDSTLHATEDRNLLEESGDWQRCLMYGLSSQRVRTIAQEGYQKSIQGRFEHMGNVIGGTIQNGQVGILLIREDHRIQFPDDIQVFYVAPPSLDTMKRWINDQMRQLTENSKTDDDEDGLGEASENPPETNRQKDRNHESDA